MDQTRLCLSVPEESQPVASKVLHKLLRWIEAVDLASQQEGAPRPEFVAEDGSPIFPSPGDEDELWRARFSHQTQIVSRVFVASRKVVDGNV